MAFRFMPHTPAARAGHALRPASPAGRRCPAAYDGAMTFDTLIVRDDAGIVLQCPETARRAGMFLFHPTPDLGRRSK
jgi:hypothetical protein